MIIGNIENEPQIYEPIGDETLFGVPVDELPEPDPTRNYFNENQAIIEEQIAENDDY